MEKTVTIEHKRVRKLSDESYVFFPFGRTLGPGFVTKTKGQVDKVIKNEGIITTIGGLLLIPVYLQLSMREDLIGVIGCIVYFVAVVSAYYINPRINFEPLQKYNSESMEKLLK